MPGCEGAAYEVSKKAALKLKQVESAKDIIVIDVPGYKSTERREVERRLTKEKVIAAQFGFVQIGTYELSLKWRGSLRPVFKGRLGRKDVVVLDLGKRIIARRLFHQFTHI